MILFPMTMIRLSLVKGLGPILQIAEGWSVALPKSVHEKLMLRTFSTIFGTTPS